MFNRPKRLTEPFVRYTSIFHTPRLRTAPVSVKNDRALPSAQTTPGSTIDYEMHHVDDNNDVASTLNNQLPTQSAPPTTTTTTAPFRSTKPPSEPMPSRLGGLSAPRDAGPNNATNDRTLHCICLTCERAATEAEHAAALRSQWSRALDHGPKGYGYRHR